MLVCSAVACGRPAGVPADSTQASRTERIAILEHAIASDHATLEALLSRPRSDASTAAAPSDAAANQNDLSFASDEGLHRDPRIRAIAKRLTRNRSELGDLREAERVDSE